ncbi:9770_t:CDS:1, partial [Paraglomus occultum]
KTLVYAPMQAMFRVQIMMDVVLQGRAYLPAATLHAPTKIYLVVMVVATLTKFAHRISSAV